MGMGLIGFQTEQHIKDSSKEVKWKAREKWFGAVEIGMKEISKIILLMDMENIIQKKNDIYYEGTYRDGKRHGAGVMTGKTTQVKGYW